ncbi:MAG: hypothetical protein H7831_16185 [Magnetococcus sp. WYHC-3]
MGAVEERLTVVETELKHCNRTLQEHGDLLKKDHDLLISMNQQMTLYCADIKDMQSDRKQDKKEAHISLSSKVWQIISVVIAAIIGGVTGAIIKGKT